MSSDRRKAPAKPAYDLDQAKHLSTIGQRRDLVISGLTIADSGPADRQLIESHLQDQEDYERKPGFGPAKSRCIFSSTSRWGAPADLQWAIYMHRRQSVSDDRFRRG